MKLQTYFSFCLILSFLFGPIPLYAQSDFNPNHILSDRDLTAYQSMTLAEIQSFLQQQGSYLSTYVTPDITGIPMKASEIIYFASRNYLINPKYILTLLQKEQGLITKNNPSQTALDWATGYAVCDGCSFDDPKIQKFKGFGRQVDRATWLTRYFMSFPQEANYLTDKDHVIDGLAVKPENTATAVLYTYTPHYQGNENLWRIWNQWFAQDYPYPDGSLLTTKKESKVTYFIQNGMKRKITNQSILKSRFPGQQIVTVPPDILQNYEEGVPLQFAQYALIESPTGEYYLHINDQLRPIAGKEVFRKLGFNPEEADLITDLSEFNQYALGTPITLDEEYPTGALLQNNKTGGVYYVTGETKHPIWSKELLSLNFPKDSIKSVKPEELETFPTGQPIIFPDGVLLTTGKNEPIYFISHGQKRLIPSQKDFSSFGFDSKKVITTTQKILDLHPVGAPLPFIPQKNVTTALQPSL